ncbi:MAG: Rrf2 family transcriptional regulator [Clostridia bacterium]|nr:Rrf2 family transcriptional regulator [Clostridia bacterium]
MISTRGRYALRLMVDLAEHQSEDFVSLKDIAARQDISKKYLEQIIPVLNRAGFLQTLRGTSGGYKLRRAPKDYTVGEILRATEGNLAPVACLESDPNSCPRAAECVTLSVWKGLQETVNAYLDGITLEDILSQKNYLDGASYSI